MSYAFLIFIVRSHVILFHHCPRLEEGYNAANMFNPPHSVCTCTMYAPVPSHEPVIQ